MSEVKLIQGDCLEEMDKLLRGGVKVDMILTDPPYLINYHTGRRSDKTDKLSQQILNDDNCDCYLVEIIPMLL